MQASLRSRGKSAHFLRPQVSHWDGAGRETSCPHLESFSPGGAQVVTTQTYWPHFTPFRPMQHGPPCP